MYYLKSTTQKTYSVSGKIIPACVTRDNAYLKVSDAEYEALHRMPVIRSLINAGAIFATQNEPAEIRNSIEGLTSSNAALIARNTELELRIKELEEKQDTVPEGDTLTQALTEAQQKYSELESEAKTLLADKDKEIEKLKKQLAKANKAE